ncbi:MAG: hypothetical protein HOO67_04070 [Candidatus Peribacteraceae bacterium]|nr:hypothetical protein [Candidatus Peribacteraceae bacterium]
MPKQILRAALLMSVLIWPVSALADAPPNVTGLSAHFESGQVFVHWDAVEGADAYRIYYGQKSILDNGGAYDDFVATSEKNTEFVLGDLPAYPKIYVAVLAVNASDEESLSFTEEIELDMSGDANDGTKSAKDVPSPSRMERESTTFGILSATAQSSNAVQLVFSTLVHIPVDLAVDAFTVIDNRGTALRPTRIVIEGSIVTLTTETQFPGRTYAVRVNDPVITDPLLGEQLPLDESRNIAVFTGYEPAPGEARPVQPKSTVATTAAYVAPTKMTAPRAGLISSGAPVLGIAAASAAIAGWKVWKKRRGQVEVI